MIYIDASRYSNTKHRTGVENYSFYLISELISAHPDDICLISPRKINLDVKQITIPFPRLWTQIRLSLEIWKNRAINNLFVPSHLMPVIHPKNTTITIHDVAFKRFPESYGRLSRWYLNWGTKFAVRHAKKIIVPSETTKQDLIKFYKAKAEKITVIPLGFEAGKQKELPNRLSPLTAYSLKLKAYFLYIGRIEHKKNIQTLIKAFSAIKNPDIKLVLAGKPGVGGKEILKKINDDRIVVTGYISDDEKQALLHNALSFVFPSLFEGFGLPLLEAMEANLPIIASKIPSTTEIAGNNALLFKPHDSKTLTHLMEEIIKKESLRTSLIRKYPEILKKYSWKNTAEKTWKTLYN